MSQQPCLFCAHVIYWQLFSVCSSSDSSTNILLPLMAVPSMLAISLWMTSSSSFSVPQHLFMDSCIVPVVPGCLGIHHLVLLALFLLLSCSLACLYMTVALMLMYMPGFLVSVSWLFPDSQSAMNSCGPGLYSIFMLYWWMHNIIPWGLCDRLTTSFFLKIVTSRLWSVITLTYLDKAVAVKLF